MLVFDTWQFRLYFTLLCFNLDLLDLLYFALLYFNMSLRPDETPDERGLRQYQELVNPPTFLQTYKKYWISTTIALILMFGVVPTAVVYGLNKSEAQAHKMVSPPPSNTLLPFTSVLLVSEYALHGRQQHQPIANSYFSPERDGEQVSGLLFRKCCTLVVVCWRAMLQFHIIMSSARA